MENKIIEPKSVCTTRLVKSEDLNHHGTLFAGRTAEWVVEAGFTAAAKLIEPKSVVCLKIHGMYFSEPARPGDILTIISKVVYAGRSTLVSHIKVFKNDKIEPIVSSFTTFINVNSETKSAPHYIEISPKTEEDILLYEQAKNLPK